MTVITRAGHHNDNSSRVADPSHESEVGEDVQEKTTRMHTPCRETMSQNADKAGFFRGFLSRSQRRSFARALRR